MPDYAFTFTVHDVSPQKAGSIGHRIEQLLDEDDAVTVTSVNTARVTMPFQVVSVDVETREVTEETVEADSEDSARDHVESAGRVVATIRRHVT
jgi:hypothetical protein